MLSLYKSQVAERRAAEGPEREGCLQIHNLEALCKSTQPRERDRGRQGDRQGERDRGRQGDRQGERDRERQRQEANLVKDSKTH